MQAQLLYWRVRHRLTSLVVEGAPSFAVRATVNPSEVVINGTAYSGAQLREIVPRQPSTSWPVPTSAMRPHG